MPFPPILIVDKDADTRLLISIYLKKMYQAECSTVGSWLEALQHLNNQVFKLIVIDDQGLPNVTLFDEDLAKFQNLPAIIFYTSGEPAPISGSHIVKKPKIDELAQLIDRLRLF